MIADRFPEIPDHELLSRIGIGGMGHVFLARRLGAHGFKKLCAVKVIDPEKSDQPDFRAMFMDEARLLSQLDHPTIAQVYTFGDSDDGLYLVMEYVQGLSFLDLLATDTIDVDPMMVATLGARVCRGLHAAHQCSDVYGQPLNVVHRDITPDNLVLTFDGRIKILDFGIALMRERTAPVTDMGYVRGKPTYLAPEQLGHGQRIDRRTDLYALSVVLWELLTGEKLFDLQAVIADWRKQAASIPPPSTAAGPLPAGLDEIVVKGLAVDPTDRFQTGLEMAEQLEGLIKREGADSLEAFAERALASAREAHDKKLRGLVDGVDSSPIKRPHPGTMVDEASPNSPEEPTQESQFDDLAETDHGINDPPPGSLTGLSEKTKETEAPQIRPGVEPTTAVRRPPESPRSKRGMWIGLVSALGIAGFALYAAFGPEPLESSAQSPAKRPPAPVAPALSRSVPSKAAPPAVERHTPTLAPIVIETASASKTAKKERVRSPTRRPRRSPRRRQVRSEPDKKRKPTKKVIKTVPDDGLLPEWK